MCSVGLGWPKVTLKARGVSPPGWGERASIRAKMECAGMLLVGRDVSVRLCLGGLPGRWGMRRVWDRGDGVGQGQRSSHNALNSCPGSRQPTRCYTNQPCREPTTETQSVFTLLNMLTYCRNMNSSQDRGVVTYRPQLRWVQSARWWPP